MIVASVIPVHNHREWIKSSIESVLRQTRRPDVICIVDDGSTDGSVDVVLGMIGAGDRIDGIHTVVLQNRSPTGPAAARNAGIQAVWEADAFALLDSDDTYRPEKIEKSLRYLEDGNIGVVYSDYETFRGETRIREYKPPYSQAGLLADCIVNCDSLVSKKALKAVGLFDPEMRTCEDYDLWIRISEKLLIAHIPEVLVDIRVGEHSSTSTVPNDVWQKNWARIRQKMQARSKNA